MAAQIRRDLQGLSIDELKFRIKLMEERISVLEARDGGYMALMELPLNQLMMGTRRPDAPKDERSNHVSQHSIAKELAVSYKVPALQSAYRNVKDASTCRNKEASDKLFKAHAFNNYSASINSFQAQALDPHNSAFSMISNSLMGANSLALMDAHRPAAIMDAQRDLSAYARPGYDPMVGNSQTPAMGGPNRGKYLVGGKYYEDINRGCTFPPSQENVRGPASPQRGGSSSSRPKAKANARGGGKSTRRETESQIVAAEQDGLFEQFDALDENPSDEELGGGRAAKKPKKQAAPKQAKSKAAPKRR
eukprot:g6838.t1